MGKTQDHRNSIEQWLAVGGWRLAVGGCWSLGAVLKGVLTKQNWGSSGQPWAGECHGVPLRRAGDKEAGH